MMDLPLTVRPADYLYTLEGEEAYGWWAGSLSDGRQVLISGWVIYFDRAGRLLGVEEGKHSWPGDSALWRDERGFIDGPIRVRRFDIPQHHVSIQDLTESMLEFLADPSDESWSDEERDEYPQLIREWLESGQYVFNSGGGDYYMNEAGEVESS